MGRSAFRLSVVVALALVGCNALIDTKDVHFDPNATNGGEGQDAAVETGAGEGGNPTDGGMDSGPCMKNLSADPKHCGRCDHDCLGGTCTAGKCDPVVLASGLHGPSGIAVGAKDVYVTTYLGNAVLAVAKDASGTQVLVANEVKARGVAVVGTTLYWANGDFEFNGTDRKGGIWQCRLPACALATRRIIAPGDFAIFPIPRGDTMFYGEANGGGLISRVPIDGGTKRFVSDNPGGPFGIALDDVHAYYTGGAPFLYRALLDGGNTDGGPDDERLVPTDRTVGFVAVDDKRVYFSYAEDNGKGHVVSIAKSAPSGGSINYGSVSDNAFPVGIALDDKNIYWSTGGTGTVSTPTGDGKILMCPKAGCGGMPPTVLAIGNFFSGPMALDETGIYWVEFGANTQASGRVRKVAKP